MNARRVEPRTRRRFEDLRCARGSSVELGVEAGAGAGVGEVGCFAVVAGGGGDAAAEAAGAGAVVLKRTDVSLGAA